MLARLKEDTDFVRTRFDAATQRIEQRAAMMDKITRVLENSRNLKVGAMQLDEFVITVISYKHRDGFAGIKQAI